MDKESGLALTQPFYVCSIVLLLEIQARPVQVDFSAGNSRKAYADLYSAARPPGH